MRVTVVKVVVVVTATCRGGIPNLYRDCFLLLLLLRRLLLRLRLR